MAIRASGAPIRFFPRPVLRADHATYPPQAAAPGPHCGPGVYTLLALWTAHRAAWTADTAGIGGRDPRPAAQATPSRAGWALALCTRHGESIAGQLDWWDFS